VSQCTPTTKSYTRSGVRCCVYPNLQRKNSILMIVSDDLRPETLAAYGRKTSITPAMDQFVTDPNTMVFDRAYANYAECAPSRLSFLSGLSPDTTGNLNTQQWLNARSSLNLTMPEFFRNLGFKTYTGGKVFHGTSAAQSAALWDVTYDPFQNQYLFGKACRNALAKPIIMANGSPAPNSLMCMTNSGPSTLLDFVLEEQASIALIKAAHAPDVPFFIAVGFYKPHLPWFIHEKYWNLVSNNVTNETFAGPEPESSYLPLTYYVGASLAIASKWTTPWDTPSNAAAFVDISRKAYTAAVAQTDSRIGVVIDRLEQLNMNASTIVLIFGDNGFSLGENGFWNKDTVYENALRVPLMIRVPWANNQKFALPGTIRRGQNQMIELLDLYRTLAGLVGAGDKVYPWIQGHDYSEYVMNTIMNFTGTAAMASYGQVRRCSTPGDTGIMTANIPCANDDTPKLTNVYRITCYMGYTVRTTEWRYTVWLNARNGMVDWSTILGEEMYDHSEDDQTMFDFARGTNGASHIQAHQGVASVP